MAFRDVIGNTRLMELMARSVRRGTLPPSVIFSGPSGAGKATAALALAQVVNCERLPDTDPHAATGAGFDACGECATCRRIARAAAAFRDGRDRPAIDCVQWLEPDERASIKIDPVRDVIARAGYRPFDGRMRVVIIDEAHALEIAAQQALLKMLEEPPPATRFVLVTAQPDLLLPTIRSRCPRFRFGPVEPAVIARVLVERHGWLPQEAQEAAARADGRLGVALASRDEPGSPGRDVTIEVLEQVARSRSVVDRLQAAQALAARGESDERRGKGETNRSRSATATRVEMSARLDTLAALLRDIGVLMTRADRARLANADVASRLAAVAPAFDASRLTRAFSAVDQAREALERNAGQKVVADWLALHI